MLSVWEKVDGDSQSESAAVIVKYINLLYTHRNTHILGNNIFCQNILFTSLSRHCKTVFFVRFEQQ